MHKSSGTTYIDSKIKGKDNIIMPVKALKWQISFLSIATWIVTGNKLNLKVQKFPLLNNCINRNHT